MKKPRHLLLIIVSVVMAFALAFTVACSGSCSSCSSCGEAKLASIELDAAEAKTEYYTGETFTSEGLKITAVYSNKKTNDTLTANSEGVSVDSTAYKKNAIGAYEIKVSYTEGDVTCDASYTVTVNEVTLSIDTSTVQVLYIVNQDNFSSDNLVVKRTVTTPTETTTTTLSASDYTIDNGGFNKAKVGTYVVTVNCTYGGKTISASYTVRVIEPRQGLQVTLKGDYQDKSTITLEGTTTEVAVADLSEAASWIQVKQPDKYGVVAANAPVLDPEDYTVEVYQGQSKIETEGLETLGGGAYTIWVTMDGEDNDGEPFVYYGFQLIYVIDNVKSIVLNSGCPTTQARDLNNTMYDNWTFTVTYESGATNDNIQSTDSGISLPVINTNKEAEGDDKNADYSDTVVVTYTEKNAKREVKTVETEEITYTLTGNVIDTSVAHFDVSKLTTGDITDNNTSLSSGGVIFNLYADGSNKFNVDSNTKKINLPSGITVDGKTELSISQRLKSGGKSTSTARYITFNTSKNFTIYVYGFSSSSSDANRHLTLAANDTAVKFGNVDDTKPFTEGVDASGSTITARVMQVSSVTKDTTFTLGFDNAINVYYICIVFN